jgi:hypothetical protein
LKNSDKDFLTSKKALPPTQSNFIMASGKTLIKDEDAFEPYALMIMFAFKFGEPPTYGPILNRLY